jgi:hypothetical protein
MYNRRKMLKLKSNILPILSAIYLLVLSILFVTIFSVFTSPLYAQVGGDSAIFRLIGSAMAHGETVYVDIFDHKGPVLFFVEYLAQLMHSGRIGIYLMQIGFLSFSLFIIYKLARLFLTQRYALVVPLIFIFLLRFFYEGGNLSEEYSLLFNISVIYLLLGELVKPSKYIIQKLIFTGAVLALVFFLRMNNAAPMLAVIASYFLVTLKTEGLSTSIKRLIVSVASFMVVCSLIMLYFLVNHSLSEMIYATFLFNLKYSEIHRSLLPGLVKTGYLWWSILGGLLCVIGGVVYYRVTLSKRMLLTASLLGFCSFVVTFVSMTGYYHYLQLLLPSFVLGTILILASLDSHNVKNLLLVGTIALLCILKISTAGLATVHANSAVSDTQLFSNNREIAGHIPVKDRDSVFGYNTSSDFWLSTGLYPSYRYYTLQDWWGAHDPAILRSLEQYFQQSPPKWLVIDGGTVADPSIQHTIDARYIMTDTAGSLTLYKLGR